jgi:hypothetical protein
MYTEVLDPDPQLDKNLDLDTKPWFTVMRYRYCVRTALYAPSPLPKPLLFIPFFA